MTVADVGTWIDVCALEQLVPGRGRAALVDGVQIAIFRLGGDDVVALGNHDPCSGANVLSRGLIGSVGDEITVASPVFKQRFHVHSGRCLDDPSVAVPVYPVRVRRGRIEVARIEVARIEDARAEDARTDVARVEVAPS
jgi:NAD(P)H-dependent nitrite reductase small subunit